MKVLDVLQALAKLPDDADLILLPNPDVPTAGGLEVLHLAGAVHRDEGIYVIPTDGVHPVWREALLPNPPGDGS